MNFDCLNIRSLNNKLNDVIEVSRDHCIDVLFLVETWHDPVDVCAPVVFTSSTSLIRAPSATLVTSHGGIAAVAFTGARLELDYSAQLCSTAFHF